MSNNYASSVNNEEISISKLLQMSCTALKRFWTFVFILIGLGGCLGFGWSVISYKPYYNASATFTMVSENTASSVYYSAATAQRLSDALPTVFNSVPMRKVIAEDMGVGNIYENIDVRFIDETGIFTVTVTASTAQRAYDILESLMVNQERVSRYVVGNLSLNIITEPVVSEVPENSVEYRKFSVYGAGAGLLLSAVFIILYALTRSFVYRPNDIEENIENAEVIGVIPYDKNQTVRKYSRVNNMSGKTKEAVSYARNALYREICENSANKTVVVTAAEKGEGASTIAANLAVSFKDKAVRAVLVECDLRQPCLARLYDIKSNAYRLNDVLSGEVDWNDAICTPYDGAPDIICAAESDRASELIASDNMDLLISELEKEYDIVILDTPPCCVSEAKALAIKAGTVLFVVAAEESEISQICKSAEQFDSLPVNMKFLLNKAKKKDK